MQTLKSFLNQAMLIWTESTGAGRVGIALLLTICIGGVVAIGVWSSQPNYVMLASELEPGEAAQMIDALDAASISYQIKGSGSIILVDKRKWSPAKIAAGKLGIENIQETMEETTPWMDPMTQREVFRRNKQKQLENSISQYKSVKSATVILSIPEKQPFIRETNLPSASVLIEQAPKSNFGESDAAAIASLVSTSVGNGLTTELVSITDTLGNVYATNESLGKITKQEEFRIARERWLSQKAEGILTQFLGFGNASVAVTTDFTFSFGTKESEEYDPDEKVLITEEVTNNVTEKPTLVAASVSADTEANGDNDASRTDGTVTKSETLKNAYGVSKVVTSETMQTPTLNMMTVSVLVNKTAVEDENEAVPPEIKTKIEELVGNAVGLRDATDQITVEFFEFVNTVPMDEEPTAAIPWDQINSILKNVSLGIAALVTLFIGLKVLKSFKPNQVEVEQVADQSSQINQLSEMVKENPEIFSKIIASWSDLDSTAENDASASKAA